MKIKVFSKSGGEKNDKSYMMKSNEVSNLVVTDYIKYIRSNKRNVVAKVLNRSEVRGGGRKPWRQKGTGNARAGSNRSPIWSGGGVTFGPTGDENFSTRLNKKVLKNAKQSILSAFAKDGKLMIVEGLDQIKISTKAAEKLLEKIGLTGMITVILFKKEGNAYKSFKNLPYVDLLSLDKLDLSKSLNSDYIVIEDRAIKSLGINK